MRKKKLIIFSLIIFLFLLTSISTFVFASSDGWVEWRNTYDGYDAFSMVETSDGGFAFCGRTDVIDPNGDFLLIKIDILGNVEWNQTYGGTDYEQAQAMVVTSDGGYALAGPTSSMGSGNRDFWLVKTDTLGNVEWNKTYGGTNGEVANALIQTSDGGYALTGYISKTDNTDCWLVKTDSSGTMEWSKVFSDGRTDRAFSVIETSDSGLVVLCKKFTPTASGEGLAYAWLIKTDGAGNIEWEKSFEGTFGNNGFPLISTSDGKIAFACSNYLFDSGGGDFWLVKLDMAGNVELNKTYGGIEKDIPYSLVEISDGGFALAGSTESFGHGNTDFWLVKTDNLGEMEWNRFYGSPEHEIAHSLLETSDGGYILTGNQLIWETREENILVIRTNIQGIPEFPSSTILPILLIPILFSLLIKRKMESTHS